MMHPVPTPQHGFTLIELSIVLVIIGLIVGGVLVGQDLIRAAAVRAQISQIEKYQTAANTFYGKYGALPGDMNAATATQFGFAARGQYAGEGDGNGVIEGVYADCAGCNAGDFQTAGETVMFWVDLASANLIDGGFNEASSTTPPASNPTGSAIDNWLPEAKIGGGNYVYVWSGAQFTGTIGVNYFGISVVTVLPNNATGTSVPGLTVAQAYAIDNKIDDGYPETGNVLTYYMGANNDNPQSTWSNPMWSPPMPAWEGQITPSATTCYDNASGTLAYQQYSISQNGGAGVNCALSFRFQ
jgi:prepilin-type N-terminal cleavage/methylation domain-containing protein